MGGKQLSAASLCPVFDILSPELMQGRLALTKHSLHHPRDLLFQLRLPQGSSEVSAERRGMPPVAQRRPALSQPLGSTSPASPGFFFSLE